MEIKKWCSFIVLMMSTFFVLGLEVSAAEEYYYSGDIHIYFSESLENENDNQDVFVDLIVLKSDFEDHQINRVVNEEYKYHYPNYQSYSHLINGDEISYLAYVKGAHLYRDKIEFQFKDENDYYKNVTKVKMIIFSIDGEVLASSEFFDHVSHTRYFNVRGAYWANYDDLSFSNTRELVFNWLWVILWVFLFVIALFIFAMKYILGLVFWIQYKSLPKSILIDGSIIIGGTFITHFLYILVLSPTLSNLLIVCSILFLVLSLLNYFFLVIKESRAKYIYESALLYAMIILILRFVVYPLA